MEPERDIEKTLRACAKQRGEAGGTPPPLHPATRKLLQSEAAKVHGQRNASRWWIFWNSRPRILAGATAGLAVLIALVVVLPQLRPPKVAPAPTKLAQLKESKPLESRNGGAAALRKDSADETKKRSTAESSKTQTAGAAMNYAANGPASAAKSIAAPVPATIPAPTVAPPTLGTRTAAITAPTATMSTPAAAPAPVTAPAAPPVLISQKYARADSNVTGRVNTGNDSNTMTVLGTFRVEQNGPQIRLIDSDGSVYAGNVASGDVLLRSQMSNGLLKSQTTDDALGRRDADAAQPANTVATLGVPAQPTAGGAFAFTVSGTNLSSRQRVEFAGAFVAVGADQSGGVVLSDATIGAGGFGAGGGGAGARAGGARGGRRSATGLNSTNAAGLPLATFRLQGQATIGTNRVNILALPVKP